LTRAAVLAPGYGGTAEQGILRALVRALARFDIASSSITFRTSGKRPSRGYVSELEDLRAACEALRADHDKIALVGRSFGGRMCAFLAAVEPPDALAILGHPISPPDRPRPADEAVCRMNSRGPFKEDPWIGAPVEAAPARPETCPSCGGRVIDTLARVITPSTCWRCRVCEHTWTIGAAANRPRPR